MLEPIFGWRDLHIAWVAVRTRYIDDHLASFAQKHPESFQLVNLGSGLDARAFRLECLRGCRAAFEVDLPEVVAAKDRAMHRLGATAKCPRVGLAVDLTADGNLVTALRAAGFAEGVPVFWLLEGLSMYLAAAANVTLLSAAAALSPPGSVVCVGFIGDASKAPPSAPFTLEPAAFAALLARCGWGELSWARFGDPALHFGRWPEGRAPDASQCFGVAAKP